MAITPARTFRAPDELWNQVLETTERRGETASGVIVAALTRYVRRHADLPLKGRVAGTSSSPTSRVSKDEA